MWQREAFTEKLADVIQVLQLARKTGMLTAEQTGAGGKVAHGTIKFLGGQIIHCECGELIGERALNQLMSWQKCHFAFHPQEPQSSPTGPLKRLPEARTQEERVELPKPLAPTRIRSTEEALALFSRLNLSRTHRQLFLLLDGQRTTLELARLIGRRPEEVEVLLFDLEQTHLIRR